MTIAFAVHGGAGHLSRAGLSAARRQEIHEGLAEATAAGRDVLAAGGSALDAVVAAVVLLEECTHFNAGRGAVLNADGHAEHDASVMRGHDRAAGAVGAVVGVRNPIRLAQSILLQTEHVLMVGEGASRLADELGLERADPSWFIVPRRHRQWQRTQAISLDHDTTGTVGAVARDRRGRLAAATSTGGMTNKLPGRVGDSACIGAGTWADGHCAVSATGHGERFIEANVAARIANLIELSGLSLEAACARVVHQELRGDGGVIAVAADGVPSLPFNSGGMLRGILAEDGQIYTGIWDELVPTPAPT
ncbi:MAG: isoaspartyl peptidase/L-asparaginase [Myxococcota bacterium]|nr:isoaspartyl peptidase/L-asparaginase [Myxococcota bacterium]